MSKKERVEDLGIIWTRLEYLIDGMSENIPHCDSKHGFEEFVKLICGSPRITQVTEEGRNFFEKMENLHRYLRYIKDQLIELQEIARGDDD